MPFNLPGGKLIASIGSNLLVNQLGSIQQINLNVSGFAIDRGIRVKETPHSGSIMGEIFSRKTGHKPTCTFRVWWDIDNPPDILLQSGWGVGIQFNLGSAAAYLGYGEAQQKYVCPCMILQNFKVNAAEQGDTEVFADMSCVGTAPIFLLPQEQISYDTYIAAATNNGWLTLVPAIV